ncbi:MAG: cytochrome C [Chitinophagaceae bacterium]|nr:MAG: cytochrome C [Chitinophagaceae bacterium]
MNRGKKIGLAILLVFIAMQFIRPARNSSNAVQTADIIQHFNAPANVAGVLRTSCYDCHSNNTRYPWYTNVQPVGWFLAGHVKDGKKELNFNEFTSYSKRKQLSKLKGVQNSVKDGSMPLSSYTLLHSDAKLSEESKTSILQWTAMIIDSLSRQ